MSAHLAAIAEATGSMNFDSSAPTERQEGQSV